MYIQARPESYKVGYYLINTANISYAWNAVGGLLIMFAHKEQILFPGLTLEKLEEILINHEPDALIEIEDYQD
jgi:hypothetical protein